MPLVEAGAERDRGGDAGGVAGVIGEPDRQAEDGRQRPDGAEVLLIVRRRVGRDAVQQGEAPGAAFAGAGHGRGHFVERRQPGRDHERLAGGRGARDQPMMGDVAAGDLQRVAVEPDQHVDGGLVEGTREPGQAVLAGPRGDGAMRRLVQLVAREDVAQRRRVDVRQGGAAARAIGRDEGLGPQRLQLDGGRAGARPRRRRAPARAPDRRRG